MPATPDPQTAGSRSGPARAGVRWSTDDIDARDRAPQWNEWIWKHFGGLHCDLYGDTSFEGHMRSAQAGDVILTRLDSNRHRVERTARMARLGETGYLKIVAPLKGPAGVAQGQRQAWVEAGGWTIYDTTGSYAVDNPGVCEHLIVMLPKHQMQERGVSLAPLMARRMSGLGISRVALETMRSTWQELPCMSEASARGAGELIMQLVRLSLLELGGQETAHTQQAALRDRIRSYVAANLRDPALSIERIAQALNCSKRHLHNAFAQDEESLAAHILRQRLDACAAELRQPAGATPRAVTDIALSWGFSNLSHFSRVFREHTGQSPSAFRSGASA